MARKSKEKLLITGFGPFPGQPKNPSAALARALKRDVAAKGIFNVRCAVLKTEYKEGLKRLRKEMSGFKPDIVLCFGVAAGEKGFRLETLARNKTSTRLADAVGFKPKRSRIIDGGELSYKATLPFSKIAKDFKKSGINVRLSKDAGSYLCNFIFCHVMADYDVKAGFVHIPVPGKDTLSEAQLLRGAKRIVKNLKDK